jgi:hypothetical protein
LHPDSASSTKNGYMLDFLRAQFIGHVIEDSQK